MKANSLSADGRPAEWMERMRGRGQAKTFSSGLSSSPESHLGKWPSAYRSHKRADTDTHRHNAAGGCKNWKSCTSPQFAQESPSLKLLATRPSRNVAGCCDCVCVCTGHLFVILTESQWISSYLILLFIHCVSPNSCPPSVHRSQEESLDSSLLLCIL